MSKERETRILEKSVDKLCSFTILPQDIINKEETTPMEASRHDDMTEDALLSLNEAESFAGIIIAAVASDQTLSDEELKFMPVMFSRMRLFHGWSAEQYDDLFDTLFQVLKHQGFAAFLNICISGLPEKLRQTAFAVAVDIVLADSTVNREEKDFLYELQKKLGLDTKLATKIIEVIRIKNRG